ncbi:putative tRNA N6-adenosine threonylcarbamoyltransferase [Cucumis melo var. makuwa]|uniref:Putative tRNA N6-adenosine threonylcarbamoyltransferase n=1 Tax=Cucumis melo var. makuwa TaxID=1194695 RepID=A0A5D3BTG8_CUCMM|nr:putative tRNA N6-adenosine threonylcarbamoyltransferase [Cucumis melo var. makuwa]
MRANLFRMVGEQNDNGVNKQIGGGEYNGGVEHNSGSDGYSEKKWASKKKLTDLILEMKGFASREVID